MIGLADNLKARKIVALVGDLDRMAVRRLIDGLFDSNRMIDLTGRHRRKTLVILEDGWGALLSVSINVVNKNIEQNERILE